MINYKDAVLCIYSLIQFCFPSSNNTILAWRNWYVLYKYSLPRDCRKALNASGTQSNTNILNKGRNSTALDEHISQWKLLILSCVGSSSIADFFFSVSSEHCTISYHRNGGCEVAADVVFLLTYLSHPPPPLAHLILCRGTLVIPGMCLISSS